MEKDTKYYHKKGLEFLSNVVKETDDLYLVHCGHQICTPGYTFHHKTRKDYHLHFVLEGKGIFSFNGKEYRLEKNDIFALLPDTDFYYAADEKEPWTYFWIALNGNIVEQNLQHFGINKETPVIHSNVPVKNYFPYITRLLHYHELTRSNNLMRIAIVYEFLADLMHAQNRNPGAGYHYPKESYYKYALNYINAKYAEVSVKDVAEYIGITSQYLANIFKEMSDTTPKQYIMDKRMKKAESLLKSSELQIQEIASAVGYKDPLTFSKVYKNYFGVSPTSHRMRGSAE